MSSLSWHHRHWNCWWWSSSSSSYYLSTCSEKLRIEVLGNSTCWRGSYIHSSIKVLRTWRWVFNCTTLNWMIEHSIPTHVTHGTWSLLINSSIEIWLRVWEFLRVSITNHWWSSRLMKHLSINCTIVRMVHLLSSVVTLMIWDHRVFCLGVRSESTLIHLSDLVVQV